MEVGPQPFVHNKYHERMHSHACNAACARLRTHLHEAGPQGGVGQERVHVGAPGDLVRHRLAQLVQRPHRQRPRRRPWSGDGKQRRSTHGKRRVVKWLCRRMHINWAFLMIHVRSRTCWRRRGKRSTGGAAQRPHPRGVAVASQGKHGLCLRAEDNGCTLRGRLQSRKHVLAGNPVLGCSGTAVGHKHKLVPKCVVRNCVITRPHLYDRLAIGRLRLNPVTGSPVVGNGSMAIAQRACSRKLWLMEDPCKWSLVTSPLSIAYGIRASASTAS